MVKNVLKIKSQLMSQLEEAKRTADEESRERQTLAGQLKNFQHENDSLREQLDDEQEVVNFWESLFKI